MRTSLRSGLLLIAFTAAAAGDVAAQVAEPAATRVANQSGELAIQVEQTRRAAWQHRVLTALGGAVLGAGVGFFASQVVIGDWDEETGKRTIDRPVWAAVGGSVGFALGFSFPFSGKGAAGPPVRSEQPAHVQIGAAELGRISARDAYEAVRLLRPQWLNERGTHVFGETPDEVIRVYLDGNHLGGVAALRLISATTIASIQFIDAAAASLRWGAGHSHGAILVIGN
jgi:hypothetical protein